MPLSNGLYGSIYCSAIGSVIQLIGASQMNQTELELFNSCVSNAETVDQQAMCLSRSLQMVQPLTNDDEPQPTVSSKAKRDTAQTRSSLEVIFRWLTKLMEQMRTKLSNVFSSFGALPTVDFVKALNYRTVARPLAYENLRKVATMNGTVQPPEENDFRFLTDETAPQWIRDFSTTVQELLKLLDEESYSNVSLKVLSPRVMPMHSEDNVETILSPDVLALYEDDKRNNCLSFRSIFSALTPEDSFAAISLINQFVHLIKFIANNTRNYLVRCHDQLKGAGARLIEEQRQVVHRQAKLFEQLERSYSDFQVQELKRNGYAFLEPRQLQMLYKNMSLPFDVQEYARMNHSERRATLNEYVFDLVNSRTVAVDAAGGGASVQRSSSDSAKLPPVALSPLLLSPRPSLPSVIGPIAVSTQSISPMLLLLRTTGLAPPAILTGSVGQQAYFVPYIAAPKIVNPHFLSLQTISPYILTPMVVTPWFASSRLLSPLVLSPRIISPLFIAPQNIHANIASPNVLSPPLLSRCTFCLTVASPSILY